MKQIEIQLSNLFENTEVQEIELIYFNLIAEKENFRFCNLMNIPITFEMLQNYIKLYINMQLIACSILQQLNIVLDQNFKEVVVDYLYDTIKYNF